MPIITNVKYYFHIFGTFFIAILHKLFHKKLLNYTNFTKYRRSRAPAARQIKMSQYSNWLHSPTHFREHSVALLSRPNVHDLWRVRFRNFLTCGFYLGGLLISFTSFLCFNYSTSWLLCQQFFYTYSAKTSSSISRSVQPQTESSK